MGDPVMSNNPWLCCGCGAAYVANQRPCDCATSVAFRPTPGGQLEHKSFNEMLNNRQIEALRIGEQALEDLPCRDRDDLIVKGLAVRAWPNVTGVDWKTWLTERGAAARLKLFDPYHGIRQGPSVSE